MGTGINKLDSDIEAYEKSRVASSLIWGWQPYSQFFLSKRGRNWIKNFR
jgi:hypothetical protein